MCGIVYKHNFAGLPVNNDILQQFDKQRSRGTQGFGLYDGQEMHMIKSSKEDKILKWLCKYDSNLIMFHHRFPTSTINVSRAAHPVTTKKFFGDTQYVMVHNGVIRNANEMFCDHSELGIDYQTLLTDLTFNDSESLLWDFALTMEGKQDKMQVYGDMAFICLKIVGGELKTMYFGRNGRPLKMLRQAGSLQLSSEGEGFEIDANTLYSFEYKTKMLTRTEMKFATSKPYVPVSNYNVSTGKYLNGTTEYDSYNAWYAAKREADRESNWQRLRRKFSNLNSSITSSSEGTELREVPLLTASATPIKDILEAHKNSNGVFAVEKKHIDVDEVMKHKVDYEPTSSEIQNCAMDYMLDAKGNFEAAYAAIEEDYGVLITDTAGHETFEDIRTQLRLEKAMEFINSDPEYENEQSTSSMWRALWNQKTLLTV